MFLYLIWFPEYSFWLHQEKQIKDWDGEARQEQEVSAKIETDCGSWNETGDGIECIVGRLWNEEQLH